MLCHSGGLSVVTVIGVDPTPGSLTQGTKWQSCLGSFLVSYQHSTTLTTCLAKKIKALKLRQGVSHLFLFNK